MKIQLVPNDLTAKIKVLGVGGAGVAGDPQAPIWQQSDRGHAIAGVGPREMVWQ